MIQFLKLLRTNSWIKNIFILFPLVFSLKLLDTEAFSYAILACVMFCLVCSVIYILNDLKDIEKDKLHPRKCLRPLAAGRIKKEVAWITIFAILGIACFISLLLPTEIVSPVVLYLIINLAYIYKLKQVFLIDSLIIATNFIIRILVGCFAISVAPSNWILVVTFFIAMLLTFIKRKSELIILGDNATKHRKVLQYYTVQLLDMYIYISATITIAAYILYTIDEQVIQVFKTDKLVYSSVFVIIGVFRFLFLSNSDKYKNEGDPTSLLLKDLYLQVTFVLWALFVVGLIYFYH